VALTKSDLAKYPFTPEAARYLGSLSLDIKDLASPDLQNILDRAERRIEEAILDNLVTAETHRDDVEISSFPIAVMMAAATADPPLQRTYALAEAKRASLLLREEGREKLMEIAGNFHWGIRPLGAEGRPYDFALRFTDFLRNATVFHEAKWKLVNRLLSRGEVHLTREEAARLMEEEVRRHIEGKLGLEVGSLPEPVSRRVERLRQLFTEKRGRARTEEAPLGVVAAAFPPCVRALRDAMASGRPLSHVGRFTLTSFLLNIGMTPEEVIGLFRSLSDFDERMTRYQVEHIAGRKGSRTKYIPPRCSTLRTHGVCPARDETCGGVNHPLAYYRRRLRSLRTEAPAEQK